MKLHYRSGNERDCYRNKLGADVRAMGNGVKRWLHIYDNYCLSYLGFSKRASVPVVVLTVLTLAIFVFALASFVLATRAFVAETTTPAAFVAATAVEHRAVAYADEGTAGKEFVREDRVTSGWLWWAKEVVRVSVKMKGK